MWILVWQTAFELFGRDSYTFKPPGEVFGALWDEVKNGAIAWDLLASLGRVALCFSLAILIGALLGLLSLAYRWVEWLIGPLILGVQSLPSICWVPMAIITFGLGEAAILFVVLIGSVGSITVATRDGLRQVPTTYHRVAATFGASTRQRLFWVSIPAALPVFVSGLKQGWSFAWRSLMAGEVMLKVAGLGHTLTISRENADYPRMFAVMIVLICVSVLVDRAVFSRLEEHVRARWGLAGR